MVDACEWEQSALLHQYVLERKGELSKFANAEDSAAGPSSISPFVPCAASRIPYILQAARIGPDDVLYDLGCGDGIVLFEAARRCGCRCFGVDIDSPCVDVARRRSAELGLDGRCRWAQGDLLRLPRGALGDGAAAAFGEDIAAPTVALAFLTGPGLVRIGPWLHEEWKASTKGLRLVTCVESLDTAMDYDDPGAMFGDANHLGWTVCRDYAKWGVFVVPPCGMDLSTWRSTGAGGPQPLRWSRPEAEMTRPVVVEALLSDEEVRLVNELGAALLAGEELAAADEEPTVALFDLPDESSFHAAAEDALHNLKAHRVLHLHGIPSLADEACGLPAIERKLVAAMRAHDGWGILAHRDVHVRSFEYHVYADGGSVLDPQHRDDGSLLTLSVLLSPPGDFEGGTFFTWRGEERVEHRLCRGDGVIFVSEKRHNVDTVRGDRRALIIELWEGPRNTRNRHA